MKAKFEGTSFGFPLTCPPARAYPLSLLSAGEQGEQIIANRRTDGQLQRDPTIVLVFLVEFFLFVFFGSVFFLLSPPPVLFFWEEFDVRNVEGYGLNDVCVDSWSKVRNLSAFFSSAIADFGGKTHPNGRIPGGLSRFSTVEREREKNVDKTECRAQVRHKLFCSVITLYLNS